MVMRPRMSCRYDRPAARRGARQGRKPTDGQLIRMLVPDEVSLIWTSSASSAITASPKPCGRPVSVTSTSNRPAWSVSAILTGSAGQGSRCASTAREQASPTASRTSSRSASSTPLRLATAVATSRAVRTWAGRAVKLTSTVGMSAVSQRLLLGLSGGDRLVHRVVDAEHLGEPGDPEDLENPLLRAHHFERPIVGPDPLQAADQDPKTGGVEELDLFHIHDELVETGVDQLDQQLTQAWRGVDVDLAFHLDDLDSILAVVIQLQIHKSSSAMRLGQSVPPRAAPGPEHTPGRAMLLARIQSRSEVMSIPDRSWRHLAWR